MSRRPPLASLRAFEAVVRAGGVGAAARTLGVTQSAVSQQLRALEAALGVALLVRDGRFVRPTEAGERLGVRLRSAFEEIDVALGDVRRSSSALTVSLLPTFAVRWLIPRLAGFQARHSDIEVRLVTTAALADFRHDGVDLAIRYGAGRWPGVESELLMREDIFPVVSPALARRLSTIEDLKGARWIAVDAEPRPADWPAWLAAAGRPDLRAAATLTVNSSTEAIAAAVAGLGVAMAHRPFAEDDLANGRLVQPFAPTAPAGDAYWLVYTRTTAARPDFRAFRTWLLETVSGSAGSGDRRADSAAPAAALPARPAPAARRRLAAECQGSPGSRP